MPYLLSATMRASILVAAATANQLALSVPSPKLSVIELTADEAKTLHDAMYRPKWLIYSISTWKTVIWCSTALELALLYDLLRPPYSEGLTAALSFRGASELPASALVGLSVLAAGAAVQVASRATLGANAESPVLPLALTSDRPLHVPPSIIDAMSRPQSKTRGPHARDVGALSLRSSHTLVIGGPYSYVRHPMYASFILGSVGSAAFYVSTASPVQTLFHSARLYISWLPIGRQLLDWLSPSASLLAWHRIGYTFLAASICAASLRLWKVARMEDEALEARFGSQWKLYKWNVPSMFLYIYR